LTDDYGDAWTTSAVTTYYNADATCMSDTTDVGCQSYPSWYDDGDNAAASAAFADQDAVTAMLFDASNIAEQVNASIQALPNDVVRNSYVWFADNTAQTDALIYPSFSTPDGSEDVKTCQVDDGCTGYKANEGPSLSVNNVAYRFPIWTDDTTTALESYMNCLSGNLCVFLKTEDPTNGREFSIDYKYQTNLDGADSWSSEDSQSTYDDSYAGLVTIDEVGSDRIWRDDIDGTPNIDYVSDQDMHVCSKRGMCDHDTGLCSCFDGYSGFRCDKRTSTGNY